MTRPTLTAEELDEMEAHFMRLPWRIGVKHFGVVDIEQLNRLIDAARYAQQALTRDGYLSYALVEARPIEGKGRGIVALRDIAAGTTICVAEVLPCERDELINTSVGGHPFDHGDGRDCIVLGVQQLMNHSADPNCRCAWTENKRQNLVYAFRDISAGDELTLDYFVPLWFDPCA